MTVDVTVAFRKIIAAFFAENDIYEITIAYATLISVEIREKQHYDYCNEAKSALQG